MIKKITRGISKEFADEFVKSDLYKFYLENKRELIIGVRNNYLNLYYNCDSIAKIKYTKGKIVCEIDKYYLDGNHHSGKTKEKHCAKIIKQYNKIKRNSDSKRNDEKKAQSRLFILNNENVNSNWYCLDIEYVKAFKNKEEKDKANFNARFDIIAISKNKPHRIALIELKYGNKAIGGKSGIYKHIKDFIEFIDKNFYEKQLKQEIVDIIISQKYLDINVPFAPPKKEELLPPDFYFITLNNNAKDSNGSTPKQTMTGYLFKDKRWGAKKLSDEHCVETEFGDITKKSNKFHATFLFSKYTLDNIKIDDIIDGDYDERILPE